MYDWCKQIGIPTVVVATKGDKIARGRWQQHMKVIRDHLKLRETDSMLVFSSETGQGRDELWAEIVRRLKEHEKETPVAPTEKEETTGQE
jgi:GTP-binding protein